jgi:hypothetical protein
MSRSAAESDVGRSEENVVARLGSGQVTVVTGAVSATAVLAGAIGAAR